MCFENTMTFYSSSALVPIYTVQQVAEMQQDQTLLEKRLELALNEAAEQRRQRVEMMTHRVGCSHGCGQQDKDTQQGVGR
jgi:hypothetical protein